MARDLATLRKLYSTDLTAPALERMKPSSVLSDKRNPGFRARRQGDGPPVLEVRYRPPGRLDQRRTVKLGTYRRSPQDTPMMPPHTVMLALTRYQETLDALAAQTDPKAKDDRTLRPALARYAHSLKQRQVVKRGEVMSLLERELLAPLGDVALSSLTRAVLVKRIRDIEGKRPGTAKELRTRAGVLLGWCVNEGLLAGNPLAGYRRERATRAERLERVGRALGDVELGAFWKAASAAKLPFGAYLLMLLLTGQRRTETALMRWRDLDLEAGVWSIPAAVTKTGRTHRVPLPALCRRILGTLPQRGELVFAGRGGQPMVGWSKRLPAVYKATAAAGMAPWTPHDLRRTMRSGLSALGVDPAVSELLLNHALSGELAQRYDRAERWRERQRAARRWALHVLRLRK